MKKSILLEKIIEKAKELLDSNGGKNIDSDYFVLAALSICNEDVQIDGVNELEKEKLKDIIKDKIEDSKAAYSCLAEKIKNSPKGFSMASLLYNKLEISVENKAIGMGSEEVTADLFLSTIFSEPTSNLQELFNGVESKLEDEQTSDEDDEEAVLETDELDELFEFLEKKKNSQSSSKEETVPEEYNLTSLIKKIKDAQKNLLDIVHGQDHAVNSLIAGYYQAEILSMTQKERNKPRATFLFTGPPGVGKTFLAEQAAQVLDIPFMRFDMSEYADKEANLEFCGSDKVYKNAKEGNVTSFVDKNPTSILLFDEVEKSHINVIHLFLQILDAGRIRDNYTDKEVSFSDTILIFTTNVGRKLYENSDIQNLSSVPRKQILNSLTLDKNPTTNAPLFPTAICSRFAAGNVIMFNRLGAHNLLQIAQKELEKLIESFKLKTKINIEVDRKVLYALLFAEGGNVDARTIRGRVANFFCQETFELFRLITSDERQLDLGKLKEIKFNIETPKEEITKNLFDDTMAHNVLIFGAEQICQRCKEEVEGISVFCSHDINDAKNIMFKNNISLILCDVKYGIKNSKSKVLNLEDVDSVGIQFFDYIVENTHLPIYIFEASEGSITQEEIMSFMRNGAQGSIALSGDKENNFASSLEEKCNHARQQNKLLELARTNKILSYKTSQKISNGSHKATITLFDFKLDVAPDVEDSKNILSAVSKPNVHFNDVIGAEDAKGELSYFVDYLKDPISYMRRGVRAPKGILLYGPPGTGKTLLAKAMAGESDVTFIATEGNSFLKKYLGEGVEKVHELFRLARKYAPAILFIDEIDVIGKDRNISSGTESNAGDVLTAFLTEMDGFKAQPDKPVFVLAATNYDIDPNNGKALDAALLRRFDRKILVDLPNKPEREKFIRNKISKNTNVVLSDDEIDNIALRSTDMSLADLESIFELALRNSIKTKDYVVDDVCFENAFESYNSGEVKKWNISELERTARHEAGHALLCWLSGETPSYLTIVARGSYGGYMQHNIDETKSIYTKNELLSKIRTSLAGRAAEVVYYGDIEGVSTGASGDLQSATTIAEQMVCVYGMDENFGLSTVNLRNLDATYYSKIKERINEILATEFEYAKKAIKDNLKLMDQLVKVLLEKNHLRENEIEEILSKGKK